MIIGLKNQKTDLQTSVIKKKVTSEGDILKIEDKFLPRGCVDDNQVETLKSQIKTLKQKMAEKSKLARKSFLLGVGGATGMGLACCMAACGSPFGMLVAFPSIVTLFMGCQTMHDKVM